MSSESLSETQTCIETADPRSIGIGISKSIEDNASNIIGILVLVLAIVAVVMAHIAIAKRQKVHDNQMSRSSISEDQTTTDRSNNTNTVDSSSIGSNNVDDTSNNVGGVNISEDGDNSEEISVNKKKCTSICEDCPICFIRMPLLESGYSYQTCPGLYLILPQLRKEYFSIVIHCRGLFHFYLHLIYQAWH